MSIFVNGTRVKGAVKRNGTTLDKVKVGGTTVYERYTRVTFSPTDLFGIICYSDGKTFYSGGNVSNRILFASDLTVAYLAQVYDNVYIRLLGHHTVDTLKKFFWVTNNGTIVNTFLVSQRYGYRQGENSGNLYTEWAWKRNTNGANFTGTLQAEVYTYADVYCA